MNIFRITIALLFCHVALSQVNLQTNLPSSIAPNTTLNLEVKITKGSISSFSKYQIDVPAGVTISESVSKTGNFTFDPPRAKIVWVNLPAEPEFVVKFIMNTGSVTGAGVFNQKLYYVDESGKKEFEAEPVNVTIDPSGASTTTSFPETASIAANNASGSSGSSDPGTSGNTSTGNTVTSSSGNSGSSGTSSTALASGGSSGNSGSASTGEVKTKENASGNSGSSGNSGGATTKKENPSGSGNSGLVYKVQLGAYGADPGKAKFSKAGKVTISHEDGLYKVITGNYNTKEEAVQAIETLKSKGFSGFVVKYQNGTRVK